MRAHYLVCALAVLTLGLVGAASAEFVVYDHFDNPANAVNTSLWTVTGTGASVASSVLTITGGTGSTWNYVKSTATWDPTVVGQTFRFKFMGGSCGYMGIQAGSHSVFIRDYWGGSDLLGTYKIMTSDEGIGTAPLFTPVAGDVLDLTFTGTRWECYDEGTLVSYSSGAGPFVTGDQANIPLVTAPYSPVKTQSWDYVAVEIPEPSTLALLGAGLVGLLCYAWRKRR